MFGIDEEDELNLNPELLDPRSSVMLESGDAEGEHQRARKGKVPTKSPPLRRKKRRDHEGNANTASCGSLEESVIMGRSFQSFVTNKKLARLRVEFKNS